MSSNRKPLTEAQARNGFTYSVAFAIFVYSIAVGAQAILYRLGWLASWGTWVMAPMVGAAVSGGVLAGWLRCRRALQSWLAEKEALLGELREVTYNINNPLNAIIANLIALKTEYNPGSVEQIEVSSRRIQQAIIKLSSLCPGNLVEQ